MRVNTNSQGLHTVAPRVVNNIHDNPELIVGNSSNVLRDYRLIKINVSNIHVFSSRRVARSSSWNVFCNWAQLRPWGPLAKEDNVNIASPSVWLVTFEENKLLQGDVGSQGSKSDIQCLGAGYNIWYVWMLKCLCTERNDVLQNIIADLWAAGQHKRYV